MSLFHRHHHHTARGHAEHHGHDHHEQLHPHAHGAHDVGEAHRRGRASDRRRMVAALAITSALFVAEVVGGVVSHSLALLSDAGHMLSDLAAQFLSLTALILAARPTDRRRTYGYYRIEILAALANGVALFALSVWILWSAWHRIRSGPQPVEAGVMTAVAAAGLLANLVGAWLLRGAQSLNVKGAYLHVLQDTLSSAAVIVGGAVMVLYSNVRGIYLVDPILSIAIGLFVNVGAFQLVRDAVDVLLEAVPLELDLDEVSASIRAEPEVLEVHDLHLWTITSGMYALSAHVVVGGDGAASDELLARVKERLMRKHRIGHTTIQIESHGYEHGCYNCERSGRRAPEPSRAH